MKNCVDNVTVDKRIRIFSNQKPWMTREVRTLLKEHNAVFRSRDKAIYSAARANLKKAIKGAKAEYKKKIEDHFTHNDFGGGLQTSKPLITKSLTLMSRWQKNLTASLPALN